MEKIELGNSAVSHVIGAGVSGSGNNPKIGKIGRKMSHYESTGYVVAPDTPDHSLPRGGLVVSKQDTMRTPGSTTAKKGWGLIRKTTVKGGFVVNPADDKIPEGVRPVAVDPPPPTRPVSTTATLTSSSLHKSGGFGSEGAVSSHVTRILETPSGVDVLGVGAEGKGRASFKRAVNKINQERRVQNQGSRKAIGPFGGGGGDDKKSLADIVPMASLFFQSGKEENYQKKRN